MYLRVENNSFLNIPTLAILYSHFLVYLDNLIYSVLDYYIKNYSYFSTSFSPLYLDQRKSLYTGENYLFYALGLFLNLWPICQQS